MPSPERGTAYDPALQDYRQDRLPPMQIDFATDPPATAIGGWSSTGRSRALTLDVDPAGGLFPGTELKLNSYDLGVDIELAER